MLPLWAKNADGKWERFPTELIEVLVDETLGFDFSLPSQLLYNKYLLKEKAFVKFRHHFEFNPIPRALHRLRYPSMLTCQYRLRKQT